MHKRSSPSNCSPLSANEWMLRITAHGENGKMYATNTKYVYFAIDSTQKGFIEVSMLGIELDL